MYFTYILRCADNTLYTGSTSDIKRRVKEHNESPRGARYTKSRRPVTLLYYEQFETMSDACKREAAIKKLTREQKESLIKTVSTSPLR